MRSTDARWHLAVEALARMPELTGRLLEVHQVDDKGYCRGCTVPGGTLFTRWPCGLHRLATAAAAGGAPAAPPPIGDLEPGHDAATDAATPPALGGRRRSAFGPGRLRPPPGAG